MKIGRKKISRVTTPAVLVIASSNTDLIITVARIPKPGETILGGEFFRAAGGMRPARWRRRQDHMKM